MRKLFVVVCLCLFTLRVFAQAVPVTPMQNAISGVMQSKMKARGFASNDPRFGITLQQAGATIAGAAASAAIVTAAGITAPAWITAGISIGLATALGYAINLGLDAIGKWLFNPDGTVTVTGIATVDPTLGAGQCWSWQGEPSVCAGSKEGVCSSLPGQGSFTHYMYPDTQFTKTFVYYAPTNSCVQRVSPDYFACGESNCSMGSGFVVIAGTPAADPNSSGGAKSAADAIGSLTDADKAKALNPAIVAAIVNQAWQQAASQPGYSGLPYDATNPITSSDAAAWQAANPSSWPTVGDAVAPQATPSGGTAASPWQLPNTTTPVTSQPATQPQTTTNPGTGSQLNLGPDPNIGAPTLEVTPTAQMILQPLLDLFPSLRNFAVPSHGGECPKPATDIFGKHVQMDGHCSLLEPVRGTLSAVMAFVWVLLALLIVLAA